MPEQQTLLGFDLVFAPDEHVFTVTAHFNNWNANPLESSTNSLATVGS